MKQPVPAQSSIARRIAEILRFCIADDIRIAGLDSKPFYHPVSIDQLIKPRIGFEQVWGALPESRLTARSTGSNIS